MGQGSSLCTHTCNTSVEVQNFDQQIIADADPGEVDAVLPPAQPLRASEASISRGRLQDMYEVTPGKSIGEGGFGKVFIATRKPSNERFAVKEIRKRTEDRRRRARGMSMAMIMNEANALAKLKHPNIIRMHNLFEDHVNVYLVMDYCAGGDLYDALHEVSSFSEKQVAAIMQQVLLGVNYMHHQKVCHRDLKPENFLLGSKPCDLGSCDLRIIDFGCAWNFTDFGDTCGKRMGTEKYMAPEVMTGLYSYSCDNFSCGVITFVLCCGHYPFANAAATRSSPVSFKHPDWKAISSDGHDLIRKFLEKDPAKRFTAEQALQHPWIKSTAPHATDDPLPASVLSSLHSFCSESLMKKAALTAIAHTFKEEDLRELRETFARLDENNDGTISKAELQMGLEKSGKLGDQQRLLELMRGMDLDGDGKIDYREFIASSMEKQQYQNESICWSAFSSFDIDGNGTVSRAELRQVLSDPRLQGLVANMEHDRVFEECDRNKDGKISFEEFYAALHGDA
eukprot:CAMPEP_0176017218 /NCGR_PEP_ID=MMETSP0120_2-20121206/8252_1 /TAXON_ID=160619 /ORGANISM="Kryptoperidinium foliaceum, Strain CCMP 1326" /LENGTH=509 /DNA_ID=CAMNT_0017350237 /DNA_START=53 /DNA_END=1582 /DNA_ORIENTATION=+